MRPVVPEPLVVAGRRPVPVDDTHVLVSVAKRLQQCVVCRYPVLRRPVVHEPQPALLANRVVDFLQRVLRQRTVRADGKYHGVAHRALVRVLAIHVQGIRRLPAHLRVDHAVGKRLVQRVARAQRHGVANQEHVVLPRCKRLPQGGRAHAVRVRLASHRGDGRHEREAPHGHRAHDHGYGRPRHATDCAQNRGGKTARPALLGTCPSARCGATRCGIARARRTRPLRGGRQDGPRERREVRPERPLAQGLLHQAVAQLCRREDHAQLERDLPRRERSGGVSRLHQLDHGVVPHVDRKRAGAHPRQRAPRHHARDHRARRHERRHRHGRDDRAQQDAPVVREGRVPLGRRHHHDERRHRSKARKLERQASPGRSGSRRGLALLAKRPHERQDAAQKQALGAGVRAVVRARRVGARHVQHRHKRGGGKRQHREHYDHAAAVVPARPAALGNRPHQQHEDGRPCQVELELQRERPEVRQRRRRAGRREVRLVAEDLCPVERHQERRHHVRAHLREQLMVRDGAHRGRDGDEDHARGKEPLDAAHPVATQANGARPFELGQKPRRRKVAGKHKQHGHAQKAARAPRKPHVIEDHAQSAHGAEPVERRDVAARGAGRLWSRRPTGPLPRPRCLSCGTRARASCRALCHA